jgi:hypothetical protein
VRASLVLALIVLSVGSAPAQESNRIKRKPPTPEEAAREASEMAKNDSLLRKGDIVATDRGFVVFRGQAADGSTNEFAPVAHPMRSVK